MRHRRAEQRRPRRLHQLRPADGSGLGQGVQARPLLPQAAGHPGHRERRHQGDRQRPVSRPCSSRCTRGRRDLSTPPGRRVFPPVVTISPGKSSCMGCREKPIAAIALRSDFESACRTVCPPAGGAGSSDARCRREAPVSTEASVTNTRRPSRLISTDWFSPEVTIASPSWRPVPGVPEPQRSSSPAATDSRRPARRQGWRRRSCGPSSAAER